jgi:3-deoxy-D-manno-octulosonate 8-phosphate phosphatase (KDO 8-P phosphatase)
MKIRKQLRTKLKQIKCLATDVDGVLTDGHIYLASENNWRRSFYIRDGLGFVLLKEKGYKTAFITSSRAEDIRLRAENLKIDFFFDAAKDKEGSFFELLKQGKYKPSEVLFIGDDVIDLPVFKSCGVTVAPADAHPDVLKRADIITKAHGGRGAAREICDLLLQFGAFS